MLDVNPEDCAVLAEYEALLKRAVMESNLEVFQEAITLKTNWEKKRGCHLVPCVNELRAVFEKDCKKNTSSHDEFIAQRVRDLFLELNRILNSDRTRDALQRLINESIIHTGTEGLQIIQTLERLLQRKIRYWRGLLIVLSAENTIPPEHTPDLTDADLVTLHNLGISWVKPAKRD